MRGDSRKNLVVVRAGPRSLHRSWIDRSGQEFDLLVSAYDKSAMVDNPGLVDAQYIPGPKVAGWAATFKKNPWLTEQYDQIALIDDDIATNTYDIASLFRIGQTRGLDLWQPSLTWSSSATYGATLRNPNFLLRSVNYVEMMAPFFSTPYLKGVLPLFSLGFESGIDLIWCSFLGPNPGKFAIIDSISVTHTRPVGSEKEKNGFIGKDYESDIYNCLESFSGTWPSCVAASAIARNGAIIKNKFLIGILSTPILFSSLLAPKTERWSRFRCSLDHVRHQLTRRPRYIGGIRERLDVVAKTN